MVPFFADRKNHIYTYIYMYVCVYIYIKYIVGLEDSI